MRKRLLSAAVVVCLLAGLAFVGVKDKTGSGSVESSTPAAKEVKMESLEWRYATKKLPGDNWMTGATKLWTTEYDGVRYYVGAETFEEKVVTEFVNAVAELSNYGQRVLGMKKLSKQSVPGMREDDERLRPSVYLNIPTQKDNIKVGDVRTFESLWNALECICKLTGAEQYGLLYRYCVEQGLVPEEKQVDREALKKYFSTEENQYLLDFTLPLLDDLVVGEENAGMVQAASIDFARWYIEEYSEEEYCKLCRSLLAANHDELETIKNKWLKDLGCEAGYREFAKLPFCTTNRIFYYTEQFGNRSEVCIRANYEISLSDITWLWQKADLKQGGYRQTIKTFLEMEDARSKDFQESRDFLKKYLPTKVEAVPVFLNFQDKKSGFNGLTIPEVGIILTYGWKEAGESLLHEYIHYLTLGEGRLMEQQSKYIEAIAYWLAGIQLENRECDRTNPNSRMEYYKTMCEDCQNQSARDTERKEGSPETVPYPVKVLGMNHVDYAVILDYVYQAGGMKQITELIQYEQKYDTVTQYVNSKEWEAVFGKTFDQIYFEAAEYAKKAVR
ncbi:MAG: hypothetical protein E7280_07270 [Lachnospiraceae bacterium]|nr:hypothetical protein [Lachnospiraceae bacterium]